MYIYTYIYISISYIYIYVLYIYIHFLGINKNHFIHIQYLVISWRSFKASSSNPARPTSVRGGNAQLRDAWMSQEVSKWLVNEL